MPEKTDDNAIINGGTKDGVEGANPDSPSSPDLEWLDAAFIAESTGDDERDIQNVRVKNAVSEGSNYCSTLLRVEAESTASGEPEPVRLIVKTLPKGEVMVNFVTELGFFRREISMLMRTLPALQELGAARCQEDSPMALPLGPRALPCSRPDTLVMEDLAAMGFRNAERRLQLDMKHCKVALAKLARLHALSVALHREDPTAVEQYGESMFLSAEESKRETHEHIEKCFNSFSNELDKWKEGTDYAERVRAVAPSAYSRLCSDVKPRKNSPFNVLNHGDFWINNFMFRYDEDGKEDEGPTDIRLVDLQMVRYSSLALDLQYFVNTSVKEEVRLNALDDLLEFYRHEFNDNLRQLGLSDVEISAEELKQEFDAKSFFGLHASICIMCVVVAEPSERLRLDELTADSFATADPMTTAWRGSRFRGLIPNRLQHYVSLGVL